MMNKPTLTETYKVHLAEYDTWARGASARISAELHDEWFQIKVTRPGKILPLLKVVGKYMSDGTIKLTYTEGIQRSFKYI